MTVKVKARISETGQLVSAANNDDWALVHPSTGRGPDMYCPDSDDRCRSKLIAVEKQNKTKGTVTRFFRFPKNSRRCTHAEVEHGVEVRSTPTASGGESDEHLWLKQFVLDVAQRCGYAAELEHSLPGVRADVWVPGATRARVEVQRVPTDIPTRTGDYPDVVWLLRETAITQSTKKYLFGSPCVQVRISKKLARTTETILIPGRPWEGDTEVEISASATVLHLRHGPHVVPGEKFFETHPIPLEKFLRQVWSGERVWYPRGTAHSFAGWVLATEYERYQQWLKAQQDIQHALRAVNAAIDERADRPARPDPAPAHPGPAPSQPAPAPTPTTPSDPATLAARHPAADKGNLTQTAQSALVMQQPEPDWMQWIDLQLSPDVPNGWWKRLKKRLRVGRRQ
ncbi:hypothetical protein [Antrihabitans cavernicola]|uniref:Uncharacterized protein n=1 Tax=Antrihabitans cavernicola TaxID=2495913 RepID=A0A5A7S187_9NOCA|nr:hypothetical protein [Spelaeibacter cavernicola]KAA0017039.1 hypothetical protein FOY51_25715 [Spelaeibacter cavernicola]